jgi:hypothetical protein
MSEAKNELLFDFTQTMDVEAVRSRLMVLFQQSRHDDVRYLEITIHEKGAEGGSLTHQDWNMDEKVNLDDFAGTVARFIASYANGKDGKFFSSAKVTIPERLS